MKGAKTNTHLNGSEKAKKLSSVTTDRDRDECICFDFLGRTIQTLTEWPLVVMVQLVLASAVCLIVNHRPILCRAKKQYLFTLLCTNFAFLASYCLPKPRVTASVSKSKAQ